MSFLEIQEEIELFATEASELLQQVEAFLLDDSLMLQSPEQSSKTISAIFRIVHTIKGSASIVGFDIIVEFAHHLETLLSFLRDNELQITPQIHSILLNAHTLLLLMVTRLSKGQTIDVKTNELKDRLVKDILLIFDYPNDFFTTSTTLYSYLDHIALKDTDTSGSYSNTIRINSHTIDTLMNIIGELVVVSSGINQIAVSSSKRLAELSNSLNLLVQDIHDHVLKMRMVPIDVIYKRLRRLIKDTCKELGKEVEINFAGADTQIDKSMIDKLHESLIHIIRNSIDHGIEDYDYRVSIGKSPTGHISVTSYHAGGNIIVEVSDDGRGLDKDKILSTAMSKGLAHKDKLYSDEDVFNLIFEHGFSTTDKITNISGRGVGMDVVRQNVYDMKGSIKIISYSSKGVTVKIILPLTVAIIEGFLVKTGDFYILIPLQNVHRCIETANVMTKGIPYIEYDGKPLALIMLHQLLDIPLPNTEFINVVIVNSEQTMFGIVVDSFHGGVKAFIKPFNKVFRSLHIFSGTTILGDGAIAMILNIEAFNALVTEQK